MRTRRRIEVFSLSFLDCICCGFGAVVLFYTIAAGQAGLQRLEENDRLAAEVSRIEEQVLAGTRHLVELRNALETTEQDSARTAARTRALLAEIGRTRDEALRAGATSLAQREHIEKLKADLKSLEEGTQRLAVAAENRPPPGEQPRAFRGSGTRRYVTGITLKGKRIAVLMDRSASMMHDDLVEIIRLRNQPEAARRASVKWRQGLDVADWLSTQFPRGSQFQLLAFNTEARPMGTGGAWQWQDAGDPKRLAAAIDELRQLTPEGGTSLLNAFNAAKRLSPLPDQIVLITDGLPTQGERAPVRRYVDAAARARLFDEAIRALPARVPVEVILLPMQGDLPAPHRFWTLARASGGSFMMPARDWP